MIVLVIPTAYWWPPQNVQWSLPAPFTTNFWGWKPCCHSRLELINTCDYCRIVWHLERILIVLFETKAVGCFLSSWVVQCETGFKWGQNKPKIILLFKVLRYNNNNHLIVYYLPGCRGTSWTAHQSVRKLQTCWQTRQLIHTWRQIDCQRRNSRRRETSLFWHNHWFESENHFTGTLSLSRSFFFCCLTFQCSNNCAIMSLCNLYFN